MTAPARAEQQEMATALLQPYPDPDDDGDYARGLRDGINALRYREHPNGVEEVSGV